MLALSSVFIEFSVIRLLKRYIWESAQIVDRYEIQLLGFLSFVVYVLRVVSKKFLTSPGSLRFSARFT